jgi:hypothetical protein
MRKREPPPVPVPIGTANDLRILRCRNQDGRVRPILLSLLSAANQLCDNEASAEEQNGDVQKDLKALVVP